MSFFPRKHLSPALVFIRRQKQRDHALLRIVLADLPISVFIKIYIKLARAFNRRLLNPLFNKAGYRRFHRKALGESTGHFYMIVMPGTLHFLIPALRLVCHRVRIVLLFNGAKKWERELLRKEWPEVPGFSLVTLPGSSLPHGDVLTLLLQSNPKNFGMLDHDLYIFEPEIFDRLIMSNEDCLLALFGGQGSNSLQYPHTSFLYFNTLKLREIMGRYRVDARLYRRPPRRLEAALSAMGITRGVYLKPYHSFFDTLNLLLLMAYADDWRVRFIPIEDSRGIFHLGGTSVGSLQSTDLLQVYFRQRFLEIADNHELREKYGRTLSALPSSEIIRGKLAGSREMVHSLAVLDALIRRLKSPENHGA